VCGLTVFFPNVDYPKPAEIVKIQISGSKINFNRESIMNLRFWIKGIAEIGDTVANRLKYVLRL
jgi:hypothetical protein